jgi:hypothetical protein
MMIIEEQDHDSAFSFDGYLTLYTKPSPPPLEPFSLQLKSSNFVGRFHQLTIFSLQLTTNKARGVSRLAFLTLLRTGKKCTFSAKPPLV